MADPGGAWASRLHAPFPALAASELRLAALRGLHTDAGETLFTISWTATGEPVRATFVARINAPDDIEWLTLEP